jgi:hypothetical protein
MAFPYLQIEGDPTIWTLSEAIDASDLTSPQPFQATIIAGANGSLTVARDGTLILSGRAAASAALSATGNAIPTGGHPGSPPFLYLPSTTGLKSSSQGYELPAGTDMATLQTEITAAMSQSEFCTVPSVNGAIVLNGAALPFVVLLPAVAGPTNAIPSG